jgi:DNA helicase TIP49 (TBP-interacting protein)
MINGKYCFQLNFGKARTTPFPLSFILHLIKSDQKKEDCSHKNLAVDLFQVLSRNSSLQYLINLLSHYHMD